MLSGYKGSNSNLPKFSLRKLNSNLNTNTQVDNWFWC